MADFLLMTTGDYVLMTDGSSKIILAEFDASALTFTGSSALGSYADSDAASLVYMANLEDDLNA